MSNRYQLLCLSHEPPIWSDLDREAGWLDDLRMVFVRREQLFALPDDLWPDDYRSILHWLRRHRNCEVRAIHEHKSDPADSVPLEAEWEPANTAAVQSEPEEEPRAPGRAIAYLGHESILRMLGQEAYDRGYSIKAVFADPAREAVAIVLTGPGLPMVETLCEPPMLNAGVEFEPKVIDGEVWTRPRIVIAEPE